jgi:hypothetical protein
MNPAVLNVYASVVGLFFFSLMPDTIAEVDRNQAFGERKHLSNLFNDPSQLYDGKIESLLRYASSLDQSRPFIAI